MEIPKSSPFGVFFSKIMKEMSKYKEKRFFILTNKRI
jgi:hypothetical protein